MHVRPFARGAALLLLLAGCLDTSPSPPPRPLTCEEVVAAGTVGDTVPCGAFDDGTGQGEKIECVAHCPQGLFCLWDPASPVQGICGEDPCIGAACGEVFFGRVCHEACELWEPHGTGLLPDGTISDTWPTGRGFASMASRRRPDGSRSTVLFGGSSVSCQGYEDDPLQLASTSYELFAKGREFEFRPLPSGPEPRCGASMVTRPGADHDTILLFGGRTDDRVFGDLWELDEDGWHELTIEGTSLPRANGGLAFDPGPPARLVQFGGIGLHGEKDSTTNELLLDERPLTWRPIDTAGAEPHERTDHVLAFDPKTRRVLLIGGALSAKVFTGELQALEPTGWSVISVEIVPQRHSLAGSWDPGRNRLVLYGGFGDTGPTASACDTSPPADEWHLDDTYSVEPTGGGYTSVSPPATRRDFPTELYEFLERDEAKCPTGRFGAALAPAPRAAGTSDSDAGLVLFGGHYNANDVKQTYADLWHLLPLHVFRADQVP